MKITILDAKTLGDDVNLNIFDGETEIFDGTAPEEVEARIADSDVVIVNKVKLFEDNLKNAKNLKLICLAATGYDNVDTDYCRKNGIAVANVVGYSTNSVAQLTVMMALSLVMHEAEYSAFVKDGSYTKSGVANRLTPVYYELAGKTWGIVGLGNIGKQVARVAEAFGCKVLAYKRTPDENYNCTNLSYLMENSDIISVHLPLTEETRGIISKEMIAKMKKNAILVNVARGAVTDEAALAAAILEGKIGGLGIDVYSKEPIENDNPLCQVMDRENVLLTPHIAWAAYESRVRCLEEIKKNIEAFFAGKIRNRVE